MVKKKNLRLNQIVIVHYPDGSKYFARVKNTNLDGKYISVQFLEHFDPNTNFMVNIDRVEE